MFPQARIIGTGLTLLNPQPPVPAMALMVQALHAALSDAHLGLQDVDGLVALPSLAAPSHFMQAHALATQASQPCWEQAGILPRSGSGVVVRTVDTGGAGPVTALLQARQMIQEEGCSTVAIVAADAVGSLTTSEFLRLANTACADPSALQPAAGCSLDDGGVTQAAPAIPTAYDRVARWHMEEYPGSVTREQLAMCSSLMSLHASRHPMALTRRVATAKEVMASGKVASVTTRMECARRADGGAAIIVASEEFIRRSGRASGVAVLGGGEASGPLWPPVELSEAAFSCREAAAKAYRQAGLRPGDIHYWSLYDCFPICLIRAIEAVGLSPESGGRYVHERYAALLDPGAPHHHQAGGGKGLAPQEVFPVNTHGGLLGFGAPWETPAMYGIIEAVAQLTGRAGTRQLQRCSRALVYGNGGVFSASAVAILGVEEAAAQQRVQHASRL